MFPSCFAKASSVSHYFFFITIFILKTVYEEKIQRVQQRNDTRTDFPDRERYTCDRTWLVWCRITYSDRCENRKRQPRDSTTNPKVLVAYRSFGELKRQSSFHVFESQKRHVAQPRRSADARVKATLATDLCTTRDLCNRLSKGCLLKSFSRPRHKKVWFWR